MGHGVLDRGALAAAPWENGNRKTNLRESLN
jgi:hypothetical protein